MKHPWTEKEWRAACQKEKTRKTRKSRFDKSDPKRQRSRQRKVVETLTLNGSDRPATGILN